MIGLEGHHPLNLHVFYCLEGEKLCFAIVQKRHDRRETVFRPLDFVSRNHEQNLAIM